MLDFTKLIRTSVPITLLTGTLPPRFAPEIMIKCGISGGEDRYNTIRVETNRREHLYAVLRTGGEYRDFLTAAKSLIYRATEELQGTQRGVIFTRYKNIAKKLGEELHIGVITADVGSEEERNSIMLNWKRGTVGGGWIMGTKSLIQGIDYPDVRFVLFLESPFGMIDFVQGAGRGGRNGETCRVALLDFSPLEAPSEDIDIGCAREMSRWAANSDECRRVTISECMDGIRVDCRSLPGAQLCDICQTDALLQRLHREPHESYAGPVRSNALVSFEEPVPTNIDPLEMPSVAPQSHRSTVVLASVTESALQQKRNDAMKLCVKTLELYHRWLPKDRNNKVSKCLACVELNTKNHSSMCLKQDGLGPLRQFYSFNRPRQTNSVCPSHAPLRLVSSTNLSSRVDGATIKLCLNVGGVMLVHFPSTFSRRQVIGMTASKLARGMRRCSWPRGSWPTTKSGSGRSRMSWGVLSVPPCLNPLRKVIG